MRRWPILLIAVLLGAFVLWAWARRSAPPEVPFTRVTRGAIVSALNTNGKVEPAQWMSVRAASAGVIASLPVERGQTVSRGQVIARLDTSGTEAQLAAAQAKVSGAQAEAEVLARGGPSTELAEIESGLQRARSDLATARREYETLQRLQQKNAATRAETDAAKVRMDSAQLQILALERRRGSLVSPPDRSAADARIRGAQAEAGAIRTQLARADIVSPMSGVLYHLETRQGAYVNPGDLIANVGLIGRLRVIVYVDEPELGRVQRGMPVTITWDALPGRQWKGAVEKTPTQIMALGTRQVGEVICVIENPDASLLPGTNVNAEIRSHSVDNALIAPKEVLRREGDQMGVFKLSGDSIVWQPVEIGVASVTHAQITKGLVEGDSVALPVERTLRSRDRVTPISR